MKLSEEPVAKVTKLSWVAVSPGKENEITNISFGQTSMYGKLCRLECLGFEEKHEKSN